MDLTILVLGVCVSVLIMPYRLIIFTDLFNYPYNCVCNQSSAWDSMLHYISRRQGALVYSHSSFLSNSFSARSESRNWKKKIRICKTVYSPWRQTETHCKKRTIFIDLTVFMRCYFILFKWNAGHLILVTCLPSTAQLKRIGRDASLQLADTASKEGKEVEKEAEKEACNALLSLTAALYASLGLSTTGKGCHIRCVIIIFAALYAL